MWPRLTTKALSALPRCDLGLPRGVRRVAVAMSGGVDSAMAAALVKAAGYEAVGLTMQLYDAGARSAGSKTCCAGQDIRDARALAARLNMPHYVLDYEARFRTEVMQPFADSYVAGQTPVPCALCNERVKFLDLLALARELEAGALVTGHYIRSFSHRGERILCRPQDSARDQSYFLFATTRAQLQHLRFPLGEFAKPQIRALAARLGLGVADKPDSQDICFVPHGRYADMVAALRPDAKEPGEIVDEAGRVLGQHQGIMHYTIGQRRGLGVSDSEPLYVLALDVRRRRVVVGPRTRLGVRRIILRDVNWLGDGDAERVRLGFRVRSSGPIFLGELLRRADGSGEVLLDVAEMGVAPGQACVFYGAETADSRLYGGGWIVRAEAVAAEAAAHDMAVRRSSSAG
ncbi:MAG: tRNA 2-thiouridine(34) synthase MnmA [Hyphomicrobiales bacterium]|nr:tRNA 2-thiouridine(34) synthase MnmA [Hyphomicrobiales bacterium]